MRRLPSLIKLPGLIQSVGTWKLLAGRGETSAIETKRDVTEETEPAVKYEERLLKLPTNLQTQRQCCCCVCSAV